MDLYVASEKGDIAKMKTAIDAGADLEWKNKDEYDSTALIIASENGRKKAASTPLEGGGEYKNP